MAKQKKNIARLVLQGISILGILLGLTFFLFAIAMIFSLQKENLTELCFSLFIFVGMLVLGAVLIYPSYKMLRSRSFEAIKSISAFLALTFFSLPMPYAKDLTTYLNSEMPTEIKAFADLAFFLLVAFVSLLVYKISMKLLESLMKAAYGPEKIPETQESKDKQ